MYKSISGKHLLYMKTSFKLHFGLFARAGLTIIQTGCLKCGILCVISYDWYNFKNMENIHGEVLFFIRQPAFY